MDATYQPSAPSPTGLRAETRLPRITCLAQDHGVAGQLASTLQGLLPDAEVESTTAAMIGHADHPDCVIALFGPDTPLALATIEHYRASGGEGAIVLAVDDPSSIDAETAAMLGVGHVVAMHALGRDLLPAILGIFSATSATGSEAGRLTRYLTQCHALLAAGLTVTRLPHRLNNPLAALLAEAELLRLEPLSREQRESVDRILEISHRLIAEVRQLEGMPVVPA